MDIDDLKLILGITGSDEDTLLTLYIRIAKNAILNVMYPNTIPTTVTDVPEKYQDIQLQLCMFAYNTRGVEGEISHSENGVNRQYEEGVFFPISILAQINTVVEVG
jgi:hypothetical protein